MDDNDPINPTEVSPSEPSKPEAGDTKKVEDFIIITLEETHEKGDVDKGEKIKEITKTLTEKQNQPTIAAGENSYWVFSVVGPNQGMHYKAGQNTFISEVCIIVIKFIVATIVFVMIITGIKPRWCGVTCFLIGISVVFAVSILSSNSKWARDRDWIIYAGVFGMCFTYAYLALKFNAYVVLGVLLTNFSMPALCMGLIKYVDLPKKPFDFSSYMPSGIVFVLSSVFAGVSIGLLTMFKVRNPHPLVVLLLGMITSALMTCQLSWVLDEESVTIRPTDVTFTAWMIYAYPLFVVLQLIKSSSFLGDYV